MPSIKLSSGYQSTSSTLPKWYLYNHSTYLTIPQPSYLIPFPLASFFSQKSSNQDSSFPLPPFRPLVLSSQLHFHSTSSASTLLLHLNRPRLPTVRRISTSLPPVDRRFSHPSPNLSRALNSRHSLNSIAHSIKRFLSASTPPSTYPPKYTGSLVFNTSGSSAPSRYPFTATSTPTTTSLRLSLSRHILKHHPLTSIGTGPDHH